MTKWFSQDIATVNKERILKAFPKNLRADIKVVLEIIPFNDHDVKLCDGNTHTIADFISEDSIRVKLENEDIDIPYRVYFNEPNVESEKTLNVKQQTILNCIYTRHHDGHVRERRLQQLVECGEIWLIPYTVQLLGEYVYEILQVIDEHVNSQTLNQYAVFAKTNPIYWLQTENRMISYWNEYYRRRFLKLKKYLGYEIVKRIKKQILKLV